MVNGEWQIVRAGDPRQLLALITPGFSPVRATRKNSNGFLSRGYQVTGLKPGANERFPPNTLFTRLVTPLLAPGVLHARPAIIR
jgi:hypothetical protein